MKKQITHIGVLLMTLILFASCNNANTTAENNESEDNHLKSEQALREANEALYDALNELFLGNLDPMVSVWSHADHVTQMGPFGGRVTGWEAVKADFKQVADMKLGGKIECREMYMYVGGDMGYVICIEAGKNMNPDGSVVNVNHRATNIFRLENGEWKLVHHHTDTSSQLLDSYEDLKNE
jgi:ketosteroid isomerase-like protein